MLELADEVAGVAFASGLAVVEARPEVAVAGVRVGEQVVGDGEDGVAGGDDRAFLAAAPGEPPVALGEEVWVREAPRTISPKVPPIQGLPLPVEPPFFMPAELFSMGANLAHDTRWPAVGFLRTLDATVPATTDIHLVMDNGSSDIAKKTKAWLATHPRFHVHHTPKHASWLNQVPVLLDSDQEAAPPWPVHLPRRTGRAHQRLRPGYDGHDAKPYRWTYDGTPLKPHEPLKDQRGAAPALTLPSRTPRQAADQMPP